MGNEKNTWGIKETSFSLGGKKEKYILSLYSQAWKIRKVLSAMSPYILII